MRPLIGTAALAACLHLGAPLARTPPQNPRQQPAVFRAGVNFVYVDAYVSQDGAPVEGLTAANFTVREDGAPQAIETFEFIRIEPSPIDADRRDPSGKDEGDRLAADPRHRVFTLLLDTFGTSPESARRAGPRVSAFLTRYLAPTDLFGVVTPLTPVKDMVFGRQLETVERMLAEYWIWARDDTPRLTPHETFLEQCYVGRTGNMDADLGIGRELIRLWRTDRVLTTLDDLAARLGGLRDERKHVLLVSDGWTAGPPARALHARAWGGTPELGITRGRIGIGSGQPNRQDRSRCDAELGRLASIDFERRQREVTDAARRANVSIFPIAGGIHKWPTGMSAFDESPVGLLRRLAEDTDGLTVVNDLQAGLDRIGRSLSGFYLLGYYSTNSRPDGRFRRIQVTVTPPRLTVTARPGYIAAVPGAPVPAKERPRAAEGPPPEIAAALAPLARLASARESFVVAIPAAGDLVVIAELSSRLAANAMWSRGVDVDVVATGSQGQKAEPVAARIDPATRGALVRVPLPPGATGRWRAVVTFRAGGERIEDEGVAEMPAAAGLAGDALMYRAAPGPRSPLRPMADFLLRRTERLHVEWPIPGALDERQVRLLAKDGSPLELPVATADRDDDGRRRVVADVTLAALGAGDYLLELVVKRGADAERRLVAFRVVP